MVETMERVTGIMIYYYFVCHKKLWYHIKGINLEQYDENVNIGKIIDEATYSNAHKHISIDGNINIDFIQKWKVLHDIKKSKSIEEAGIWQMKYYMYYLEQKGIKIEYGMIDYPIIRERKKVLLSKHDKEELDEIVKGIEEIKNLKSPPSHKKTKICDKCAFYAYCYC